MTNLKIQSQRKYHFLYKTTNLINGMIYVGAHSTNDMNDNYVGSGFRLKLAIKRYGLQNFHREILESFNSPKEMFDREKELVNEEFIKRKDVYNIITGGFGGANRGTKNKKHLYHPETKERCAVDVSAVDKMIEEGWTIKRVLQNGNTSSTKDTIWIYKSECKKMIQKEELEKYLNMGWSKGLPKSPTKNKVWIYNKIMDKYSLCDNEELNNKLLEGWIKKKWSTKGLGLIQKGTKLINNGKKAIKVHESELKNYINSGWTLGKLKK